MEATEAVAGIGHNSPPEPTLPERLAINHKATVDKVDALRKEANDVKALVTAAETPDELGVIAGLNDEIVAKMVAVGKSATKLATAIKDERLDTTKPLRDDVETINGFFNTLELPINRVKSAFAEKVGAYDELKRATERREAAERARIAEEEAAAKLQEAAEAQHSVMGDVLLNEAVKAEEEAQMAANAAVKAGTGPTRTEAGSISQSTKFAFEILDSDKIPLDLLRPYIKLADFEKFVRAYVATHKDKKPLAGVRIFPESKTSFR
jgi:hypothetical protein